MTSKILFCATLLISSFTFAQESRFGKYLDDSFKYDWTEEFNISEYEPLIEFQDSSLVIQHRYIISFALKNSYYMNRTRVEHKIYYIGNSKDIEEVNRLYLYKGDDSDLEVKVRTITSDGKVVELDESKMEDVSTNEGSSNYTILAIPGIEEHSWVEILTIQDKQSAHTRFMVDNPFKTVSAELYFHSSPELEDRAPLREVRYKNYGNFVQYLNKRKYVVEDFESEGSDYNESEVMVFRAENIERSTSENYSHEYEESSYVDVVDIEYTWKEAGAGIGSNIFPNVPRYRTDGTNWLRKLEFDDASPLDQIHLIEKYVKQTITKSSSDSDDFDDTRKIWKKRLASETGINRMTMQLIDAAEIPYEVYLCSDKDYIQIDKRFPFTRGLNNVLFYFPREKVYMLPSNDYFYTNSEVPNFLAGSKGIIVRSSKESAVGDIIDLPSATLEYNVDATKSVVSIDPELEICTVEKSKLFFGDRAIVSRGYYHFSDDDERKEYMEELIKGDIQDADLGTVEAKNIEFEKNVQSSDTVVFSGKLTTPDMLSAVPNGFILNLGKVIGSQTSFYGTEDRISNIYLPESKIYSHSIDLKIPEGYTVEGVENLEFDYKFEASDHWGYNLNESRKVVDEDLEKKAAVEADEEASETKEKEVKEMESNEETQEVLEEKVEGEDDGETEEQSEITPLERPDRLEPLEEKSVEEEEENWKIAKSPLQAASFKSSVTIENDVLHIDIHEFYIEGFYPKEDVEELQKVVNAAYEFYIAKIKLVEM